MNRTCNLFGGAFFSQIGIFSFFFFIKFINFLLRTLLLISVRFSATAKASASLSAWKKEKSAIGPQLITWQMFKLSHKSPLLKTLKPLQFDLKNRLLYFFSTKPFSEEKSSQSHSSRFYLQNTHLYIFEIEDKESRKLNLKL